MIHGSSNNFQEFALKNIDYQVKSTLFGGIRYTIKLTTEGGCTLTKTNLTSKEVFKLLKGYSFNAMKGEKKLLDVHANLLGAIQSISNTDSKKHDNLKQIMNDVKELVENRLNNSSNSVHPHSTQRVTNHPLSPKLNPLPPAPLRPPPARQNALPPAPFRPPPVRPNVQPPAPSQPPPVPPVRYIKGEFTHLERYGKFGERLAAKFTPRFDIDLHKNECNQTKNLNEQKEVANDIASLQFSWVGHVFGLKGKFQIGGKEENFEGNYPILSASWIADANIRYLESNSLIPKEDKDLLKEMSLSSVEYACVCGESSEKIDKTAQKIVDDIDKGKPVSIPTGWAGHTVNVTIYKDMLIYTNRGERGSRNADQVIYKINGKIDKNAIIKLIDSSQLDKKNNPDKFEYFENKGLINDFNLTPIAVIDKVNQKVGNCTFANTKGGLQAAAFAMEYKRNEARNLSPAQCYIAARKYSQKIFKGAEMVDRLQRFKEFTDLEQWIYEGKTDLTLQQYNQTLAELTGKFSKQISEEKKQRLGDSNVEQRFDQYLGSFYEKTGAKEASMELRRLASDAVSKIQLSEMKMESSWDNVCNELSDKITGTFVFYLDSNDGKYYLAYNTENKLDQSDVPVINCYGPFNPAENGSFLLGNKEYHTIGDLKNDPAINQVLNLPTSVS